LTQAFAIARAQNRADMTKPPLYICAGERLSNGLIVGIGGKGCVNPSQGL